MFESLANKKTIPVVLAGAIGGSMLAGCGAHHNNSKKIYKEIVQFNTGSPTFRDYKHFSEPGPTLHQHEAVRVDCLAVDKGQEQSSTHGLWYHLLGPRAVHGLYSPSNNFENGVNNPNAGPAADPQVPNCPSP